MVRTMLDVIRLLMWAAHGRHVLLSLALCGAAVLAWSLGEVAGQTGMWTLSFVLTEPDAAGAYQGVFATGWHAGVMLGPLVVTSLALAPGPRP
jgi:hypothetical protein